MGFYPLQSFKACHPHMGATTLCLGRRNTECKKEVQHLLPAHLATKGKLLPMGRRPEFRCFANSSSSLPCEEPSTSSGPRQSRISTTTRKTSEEYGATSLPVITKTFPPPRSLFRHPLDEQLRGGGGRSFIYTEIPRRSQVFF